MVLAVTVSVVEVSVEDNDPGNTPFSPVPSPLMVRPVSSSNPSLSTEANSTVQVRDDPRTTLPVDGSSGHMAVRGDPGHEILDQVAPRRGDLVLDKNTSSAFHSSPMDLLLRNMKVETLVLTGLATDQCVLATAIDAADRGFHVIMAADACAGFDAGSAEAVQIRFGRV